MFGSPVGGATFDRVPGRNDSNAVWEVCAAADGSEGKSQDSVVDNIAA